MNKVTTVSHTFSDTDKTISFETGKLALQANGAVVGRLGDTMVLVTATAAKGVREGVDFFPLTVDIEERMYAAGKIPGSFFRREGRASDQAILTARLIDRPLRPSFPKGFRNEVHVVGTILGADLENPHDVLAINCASAALMVSGIPFEGPVGAVRMAFTKQGEWIAHPTYQDGDDSSFELVVAGKMTSDGNDVAIIMVEAGGTTSSWKNVTGGGVPVTEERIAEGLEASKRWIKESIDLQKVLVAEVGELPEFAWEPQVDYSEEIFEAVEAAGLEPLRSASITEGKTERQNAIDEVEATVIESLTERFPEEQSQIKAAFRSLLKKVIRDRVVRDGVRIDGRDLTTVRPLYIEVGVVPTAHGSGLFQRGETQVLNICTLGMPKMNQMIDTIGVDDTKRYMHHYNFPPFSTGETGRMTGPKRREIGHGLLAERALVPVVPSQEEFAYTLRLVSEVLSSNGSTSMASVCGSTLSLMDAGVPIKAPVAGIAMGLIAEGGSYVTLTDILGAEDAFGDMDFKVAGTSEFVTALQLDTKIDGIPAEVLGKALLQAKEARLYILEEMQKVMPSPRGQVAARAPKIISFEVPIDKIGEIIGPKGKTINTLQQESGAEVSIEEMDGYGLVTVGSTDIEVAEGVRRKIMEIVDPPKAEVGAVYVGRVVNITKFGAFVNILPGRDGLLHISKIGGGKRIDKVEDVLSLDQEISVRVDDIDPQGKLSLSLSQETVSARRENDVRENGDTTEVSEGSPGELEEDSVSKDTTDSPSKPRVSFEESFQEELVQHYGDLGPDVSKHIAPQRDRGPRRSPRRQ
ncbi:polyribonucleotide nucleotidyltransferase [Ferrithrix thermotolerans DSM 19514]|uniref:Polyribonucleotide nucleotidyltransferase n=1 Tax=Ferrithrix thermotolerans DSM 19514 TaxID=1121881 RepID=A0A1M4TPH0_9ACTN|nr:polyribonucleotide nucleotidyltransferase [Ferrithrix thermotolerans]SHE46295.1 polyribonucleotide nucleotidyltransferase [Ferrithrix thermotolerans DSM 19514]